jgi:hypothetical protein
MQGAYYLLSIVAVFVVFVWYIRNEKVPDGAPTKGLLAMKEPNATVIAPKARSQHQRRT